MQSLIAEVLSNAATWQDVVLRAIDVIYAIGLAYMAYKFGAKRGGTNG